MAFESSVRTEDTQVKPKPAKAAKRGQRVANRIEAELFVGLTKNQAHALDVACEFGGVKPSVYGRGAILNRLVAEGWLKHPGLARFPEYDENPGGK